MSNKTGTQIAISLLTVLAILVMVSIAQEGCTQSGTGDYEKINIIGLTTKYGIYDPSVEYDENGTGWLAFTVTGDSMELDGRVDTGLARSTDHGKTWTFVKEINLSENGGFIENSQIIQGMWRHETASLVYDPDDPNENRRWKLFWIKAFSRTPIRSRPLDVLPFHKYALVMLKYASTPAELSSSPEITLFSANHLDSYPANYNLNEIHPNSNDFYFFMEPGGFARNGILYLSLHAAALLPEEQEIFLLASKDFGQTWEYVDPLISKSDAESFGYYVFTSSSLVEEDGRVFLMVSPAKNDTFPKGLKYYGIHIFEFDDITLAKIKRDNNGKHVVQKYISPLSQTNIGGGQSDYHSQNMYGGIIMAQSNPNTVPGVFADFFQIYNTNERIVELPVGIDEEWIGNPTTIKLLQNYPNPFGSSTTIEYTLSHFAHVILRIYDVFGREIITLIDEKKMPGQYSTVWHRQNNLGNVVPDGIYLLQMGAGNLVQSKQLLLTDGFTNSN